MDKDYTGASFQSGTVVYDPDTLHMDPQSYAAIVRFTAPNAGDYQVAGLFRMQDTGTHAHDLTIVQRNNLLTTSPSFTVVVYSNVFLAAYYAGATRIISSPRPRSRRAWPS